MKSAIRERITPFEPIELEVKNMDGSSFKLNWKLSYDLNAIAAFEDLLNINFLANISGVLSAPSVTQTTALFWVGLLEHQPELNNVEGLRAVRKNVTLTNIGFVRDKVITAFLSQLPDEMRATIEEVAKAIAEGKPADTAPLAAGPTTPAL